MSLSVRVARNWVTSSVLFSSLYRAGHGGVQGCAAGQIVLPGDLVGGMSLALSTGPETYAGDAVTALDEPRRWWRRSTCRSEDGPRADAWHRAWDQRRCGPERLSPNRPW